MLPYCDCIAVVALANVRVGSRLAPPWVGQFCQRTRQMWDTAALRLHFRLCLKVWKRTTTEWSSTLGWTHWFSWMLMVYLVYQWISLVLIAKAGTWGLDIQGRDVSPLPRQAVRCTATQTHGQTNAIWVSFLIFKLSSDLRFFFFRTCR